MIKTKILLITALILFGLLILGNVSATSTILNNSSTFLGNSTEQSSQLLDPYENPDIDGDIVVYQKTGYNSSGGLNSSDIYWKNLTSAQSGRVSSYYGFLQENPSISGTKVVWQDNREGIWAIYWKDILSGKGGRVSTYTGTSLKQINADISGTKVVWQDNRTGKWAIYWKDILSGKGGRVSTYTGTNLNQINAAISGTKVVWEDFREGKYAIYWKDFSIGNGGRVSQYTGSNLKQLNPAISGTKVVWQDYREGASNPVTYLNDIFKGIDIRVSTYNGVNLAQIYPAISGNKVVWSDFREGNYVVYWKDVSNCNGGRVSVYTGSNLNQVKTAISCNKLVWQDLRYGYLPSLIGHIENWSIWWKDVVNSNNGLVVGVNASSSARTVYITTDNIVNVSVDTARVNTIINALKAMGLNAVFYGLGPNTHYSVLQSSNVPPNALIVDIYGGADAGLIYEMGQNYYKNLVASREVFSVWLGPPLGNSWDITGLAWLPRAHDDDYSPSWFTGLANPDQYLLNNGYHYIYATDLNSVIYSIYTEATT